MGVIVETSRTQEAKALVAQGAEVGVVGGEGWEGGFCGRLVGVNCIQIHQICRTYGKLAAGRSILATRE